MVSTGGGGEYFWYVEGTCIFIYKKMKAMFMETGRDYKVTMSSSIPKSVADLLNSDT